MKLTRMSMLVSCLLFAFSANLSLGIANSASDAVHDIAGHEVLPGVNYFIVPAEKGKGGGLTVDGSCPHEVIQALNEPANGLPVQFSPVNHHDRVVRTNNDLNIKFVEFHSKETCHASKVWKYDANKQVHQGNPFVTTGGLAGITGGQSLPNWFKIQKFEDAYKLEYCPSQSLCNGPCVDQTIVCSDIGVVQHEGSRHVAVQPPALKVKFKKV